MKFHLVFVGVLCLAALMAASSYAGVAINGTTITFSDSTMQSTAQIVGPQGPKGDKGNQGDPGADGADGSDANVPAGHAGSSNSVNGTDSFIGGGSANLVTDDYGTIGAGQFNQAGDNTGGPSNKKWATVGGGRENTASGSQSTVAGGKANTASGDYSTASGGWSKMASGDYSFAAGISANDGGYDNVFVWDDGTGSDAGYANTFNVNASGGIYLNGVQEHLSDRNKKKDFSFVSGRDILDKVVELPIQTWRFKTEEDSISHIGPMAQDFMAAFGYGLNERYLSTIDMDGVTLAAIQGLNAKLEDTREELAAQAEVNTALRWHNAQLEARLARLEQAILRQSEREPTGAE